MKKKICSVEGCEELVKARGLCNRHYLRMKRGYPLERKYTKQNNICSVEGCDKKPYAKNLCIAHYRRWKKHGTTSEEPLRNKTRSMSLLERLQFYSQKTDGNDCFIWEGRIGKDGYGIIWWNNHPYRVHRISYELYNGEIPKGMFVCHKCNNKLCVNPDHLYAATPAKNTQDAIRDGLITWKTGEDSLSSKLTKEQAIEIIKRRKNGEKAEDIAKDYGISHWTVGDIYKGKSWAEIDRDSIQGEAVRNSLGRIKNVKTKLTEEQVRQIKKSLLKKKSLRCLAEEFGVSKKTIQNIKNEKIWRNVSWPLRKRERKRKINEDI